MLGDLKTETAIQTNEHIHQDLQCERVIASVFLFGSASLASGVARYCAVQRIHSQASCFWTLDIKKRQGIEGRLTLNPAAVK